MAFNPPSNPSNGDNYTYNGITYVYEDIAGSGQTGQWVAGDIGSSQLYVLKNGDTMTGDLVVGNGPNAGNGKGCQLTTEGQIWACQDDNTDILFEGWKQGTAASTFSVRADGQTNIGTGTIGASSNSNVVQIGSGYGQIQVQASLGSSPLYRGYNSDGNLTFIVRGNGSTLWGRDFHNVYIRHDDASNSPGIDINVDTTSTGYSGTQPAFRIRSWNGTTGEQQKCFFDYNGNAFFPGSLASSSNSPISANPGGKLIFTSSDRRLKENITPLSDVTDKVKNLNPISYQWKDKEERGARTELGFIAQDMEEVFPEVTFETLDGTKGINYPALVSPLTKALQEALTRIEALEAQLTQLTGGASS